MTNTHLNKNDLKQPDLFQVRTTSVFDWVQKNIKIFIGLIVCALILSVGALFYSNHKTDLEEKASSASYEALKNFDGNYSKLSKSDSDWENKVKADVEKLVQISKAHANTLAAFEIEMKLGNVYYEHGNFEKAVSFFDQATKSANVKKLKISALYSKAYALESLNKSDEAISIHANIISENIKSFKADSMLALARLKLGKGDKKAATDLYNDFLTQFQDSNQKARVEALKALIQ